MLRLQVLWWHRVLHCVATSSGSWTLHRMCWSICQQISWILDGPPEDTLSPYMTSFLHPFLCALNMLGPQAVRGVVRSTDLAGTPEAPYAPLVTVVRVCGPSGRRRWLCSDPESEEEDKLSRGVECWTESLQGGVGEAKKEWMVLQAAKTYQKALRSYSKIYFGNKHLLNGQCKRCLEWGETFAFIYIILI